MEGEIPSQGIKDLYNVNLKAGRAKVTDNLLIRFPSLKGSEPEKVAEKAVKEPEVEANGSHYSSRRKKR